MGNSASLFWKVTVAFGKGHFAVNTLPVVGSYKGMDNFFAKIS